MSNLEVICRLCDLLDRAQQIIRIGNGESFEDIAADYPALTTDDLEAIRAALNV